MSAVRTVWCLWLAGLLTGAAAAAATTATPRNVLLICVDEPHDRRTDPQETRNHASEQPEVVTRIRATLARHPEAR